MNPIADFKTKYGFGHWLEMCLYKGNKDVLNKPVKVAGVMFNSCKDAYKAVFNKNLVTEKLAQRIINQLESYKMFDDYSEYIKMLKKHSKFSDEYIKKHDKFIRNRFDMDWNIIDLIKILKKEFGDK